MAWTLSGNWKQGLFLTLMALCALPFMSPPMALVLGIAVACSLGQPLGSRPALWTKQLLQYSVIGLGFGMNLQEVLKAGASGILVTLLTILGTLGVGWSIGRALKQDSVVSHLINTGTAICGGSAIAAVGPVLGADSRAMSVALGTVFVLNSLALLIFPVIGHQFHLSEPQFGLWAAIAIHDTSSVVGAAAKYGNQALQIATTVKLARALWIVPLTLATAWLFKRQSGTTRFPTFILGFLLASVLQTYLPPVHAIAPAVVALAKAGLKVTLFLIGTGLSLETLRAVGIKPFAQGVVLWVLVSVASLWLVMSFSF